MTELTEEDRDEINQANKIELYITPDTPMVITRRAIEKIGGEDVSTSDIMEKLIQAGLVIKNSGGTYGGVDYPKRYWMNYNMADQYRMFGQGGFPVFPRMAVIDVWWYFA